MAFEVFLFVFVIILMRYPDKCIKSLFKFYRSVDRSSGYLLNKLAKIVIKHINDYGILDTN